MCCASTTSNVMEAPGCVGRKAPHHRSCVEMAMGMSNNEKTKFQLPIPMKIDIVLFHFFCLKHLTVLNQQYRPNFIRRRISEN